MREFDAQVEFVNNELSKITKIIIYKNGSKYSETIGLE